MKMSIEEKQRYDAKRQAEYRRAKKIIPSVHLPIDPKHCVLAGKVPAWKIARDERQLAIMLDLQRRFIVLATPRYIESTAPIISAQEQLALASNPTGLSDHNRNHIILYSELLSAMRKPNDILVHRPNTPDEKLDANTGRNAGFIESRRSWFCRPVAILPDPLKPSKAEMKRRAYFLSLIAEWQVKKVDNNMRRQRHGIPFDISEPEVTDFHGGLVPSAPPDYMRVQSSATLKLAARASMSERANATIKAFNALQAQVDSRENELDIYMTDADMARSHGALTITQRGIPYLSLLARR